MPLLKQIFPISIDSIGRVYLFTPQHERYQHIVPKSCNFFCELCHSKLTSPASRFAKVNGRSQELRSPIDLKNFINT